MNITNGLTKNIKITGYERSTGKSEKCKNEKNPDGSYDIIKFWYTEDANIDKPNYECHGSIGRYFTIGSKYADELIGELTESGYELWATVTGSYGKSGELRVTSIDTEQ